MSLRMNTSYRNGSLRLAVVAVPVRKTILILAMAAAAAASAEQKFSAADVPNAGIRKPGKIVISNTSARITAYRFFGNIREALVTLRSARGLAYNPYGPSLFDSSARVRTPLPAYLSAAIQDAAQTHRVDPRLLAAVAHHESGFNASVISRAGAIGIMQLMPDTARFLGVNAFDARENIFGGARYLRTLLDTFHGDLNLTLAAYNAGPGAVQRYGGVPPYRETQAYVKNVRAAYEASLR
jgi:soluble lytic murein transglycosylase-like protein